MAMDKADHLMLKPNIKKTTDRTKQYIATIAASLGGLCSGTVFSWSSPALAGLTAANSTMPLTLQEKSLIGAIINIGALLSTIPMGFLVDKFGRKPLILTSSFLFTLQWVLIVMAQNPLMLIFGRFFGGLGCGTILITTPMYLAEIAEPQIRGKLISIFQLFLSVGVLLPNFIGFFVDWYLMSIILSTLPVVFFIFFVFMPESPIFLLKQGRRNDSEKVLKSFRGKNSNIEQELMEIEEKLQESLKRKSGIKDVFSDTTNRRALIAAIAILFFQQFCGISAVIFYTVTLFQEAGTAINPNLAAILITTVKAITAFIFVYIIEKAKRKTYLKLSSIGMFVCLVALGVYFHLQSFNIKILYFNYIPIISVIFFVIFFSIGYGPMAWVLLGELFAPEVKGLASGLAYITQGTMTFIVTYTFPIIKEVFGNYVPFYIFAFFMVVATIFVHFRVPETRGKTLPQIQDDIYKGHFH